VVNFRNTRPGFDDRRLDGLNQHIVIKLQEQGIAVPSLVTIKGKKFLHVAITNHRSRREDFDLFVQEAIRIGKELEA
jgi:aromatic-L-amino-acid decarboxylase